MTVRISRGTYLQNLSGCKMSRFPYKILPPFLRILKLYIELLMGFSTYSIKRSQQPLTLSMLCPWNSSQCGHSEQNVHFKDREGVRSLGQLVVLSSLWPPPKKLQSLEFAWASCILFWKLFPPSFISFQFVGVLATFELRTPLKLQTV